MLVKRQGSWAGGSSGHDSRAGERRGAEASAQEREGGKRRSHGERRREGEGGDRTRDNDAKESVTFLRRTRSKASGQLEVQLILNLKDDQSLKELLVKNLRRSCS